MYLIVSCSRFPFFLIAVYSDFNTYSINKNKNHLFINIRKQKKISTPTLPSVVIIFFMCNNFPLLSFCQTFRFNKINGGLITHLDQDTYIFVFLTLSPFFLSSNFLFPTPCLSVVILASGCHTLHNWDFEKIVDNSRRSIRAKTQPLWNRYKHLS